MKIKIKVIHELIDFKDILLGDCFCDETGVACQKTGEKSYNRIFLDKNSASICSLQSITVENTKDLKNLIPCSIIE